MHFRPDEIPPLVPAGGTVCFRSIPAGDSGMEIGATQVTGPSDTTALYKGLPDDACPCEHFGYVISGAFRVRYLDGSEEIVSEGEIYYIPKGHFFLYDGPCEHVEVNPSDQLQQLLEHTGIRRPQASGH